MYRFQMQSVFVGIASVDAKMEFEFDESKSRANQLKHGIDFVLAQALWLDDNRIALKYRRESLMRCVLSF